MNFLVVLEWIADASNFLFETISVEPLKRGKFIRRSFGVMAFMYTISKLLKVDVVNIIIHIMQDYWWGIILFIFVAAVMPPLSAFLEKRHNSDSVQKDYIWKNLIFNILGGSSAAFMICAAYWEIGDFRFIADFHIDSIVAILVPICVWIVFSYQSTEQEKYKNYPDTFNHDPSLKWTNQMLNVLHLINVCFWSLLSAVLVIAYTLYCHIHNIELILSWRYLLLLTIVLLFFYGCALVGHDYIKLVFLVDTPLILICSMYWMSWFEIDERAMVYQFIFFFGHSLVYTVLIYIIEKVVVIYKSADDKKKRKTGKKRKKVKKKKKGKKEKKKKRKSGKKYKICFEVLSYKIKIRNTFSLIAVVVILSAYVVFLIVPYKIVERDSIVFVRNCVIKICEDTDTDAEALLDEIEQMDWCDMESGDADRAHFLKFISDNFHDELVDKKAISEKDEDISYEELVEWYINLE